MEDMDDDTGQDKFSKKVDELEGRLHWALVSVSGMRRQLNAAWAAKTGLVAQNEGGQRQRRWMSPSSTGQKV